MKKRTQGRETANTASQHKLSDLDVKHYYYNNNAISDRSRSKAKQPDGMSMREWRKGPGSKYMIKRSMWQTIAPRGPNTSGPLAGKTATSFNNPPMGPPSDGVDRTRKRPNQPRGPNLLARASERLNSQRLDFKPHKCTDWNIKWQGQFPPNMIVKSLRFALKLCERIHTLLTNGSLWQTSICKRTPRTHTSFCYPKHMSFYTL